VSDRRGAATGWLASGEIQRRFVHASGALVPLAYVAGVVGWRVVQGVFVLGAAVAFVLEVLRLYVGLDWAIYDRLTREYESDNPAGYALYMLSMAGVALLCPSWAALPGMFMLAVGDPISGLLSSRSADEVKSPSTLLAMFVVSFGLAAPFLLAPALGVGVRGGVVLAPAVGALTAALGAAGATVADGVKPVVATYVIDDNLTIAPVACALIWAAVAAVG